jgi:hypothetical protein
MREISAASRPKAPTSDPPHRGDVRAPGRAHAEAVLPLDEQHVARLDAVGDHGRRGGAHHAPAEREDERPAEDHVDHVGQDGRAHRRARVALPVADLAQRDVREHERRAEDAHLQVLGGEAAGGRIVGDAGQERRQQHAEAQGDHADGHGEEERGAEVRADLVATAGAERLRDQGLGPAQEPEAEAEEDEGGGAAQADAGQLGGAEASDEQRVDQRHDAVGDGRHGDGPGQDNQLARRSGLPGQGSILSRRTCQFLRRHESPVESRVQRGVRRLRGGHEKPRAEPREPVEGLASGARSRTRTEAETTTSGAPGAGLFPEAPVYERSC